MAQKNPAERGKLKEREKKVGARIGGGERRKLDLKQADKLVLEESFFLFP